MGTFNKSKIGSSTMSSKMYDLIVCAHKRIHAATWGWPRIRRGELKNGHFLTFLTRNLSPCCYSCRQPRVQSALGQKWLSRPNPMASWLKALISARATAACDKKQLTTLVPTPLPTEVIHLPRIWSLIPSTTTFLTANPIGNDSEMSGTVSIQF